MCQSAADRIHDGHDHSRGRSPSCVKPQFTVLRREHLEYRLWNGRKKLSNENHVSYSRSWDGTEANRPRDALAQRGGEHRYYWERASLHCQHNGPTQPKRRRQRQYRTEAEELLRMVPGSWMELVWKLTVLLSPYRDTAQGTRAAAGMYVHAVMFPNQLTRSKLV